MVEIFLKNDGGSENLEEINFGAMLEESFKKSTTGNIVKGVVMAISPTEIYVDIGRKQSGYVPLHELSSDPNAKIEDLVKKGDEMDLLILKTDNQEGMCLLSKKRLDANQSYKDLNEALKNGSILNGTVEKIIQAGLIVTYKGVNLFIPASHADMPKSSDVNDYLNKEVKFKIIEIDRPRNRVVGSIKNANEELKKHELKEFWDNVEINKKYKGVIKILTNYGAFVDLGCIDGLIHISELSWDKIQKPEEVLTAGQEVEVYIKSIDSEKGRISLGYKNPDDNPWIIFKNNFHEGKEFETEILSIKPYGAFARVMTNIDGLIHISEISDEKVKSVGDVLSVGQKVKVKVKEINDKSKKVSLTMK